MARLFSPNEPAERPPKAVQTPIGRVFQQTLGLITETAAFAYLAVTGFIGNGSSWYLAGLAWVVAIGTGRVWLHHHYAGVPARAWARRNQAAAWLAAAGWGAWAGLAVLFEPIASLVTIIVATQMAITIGAVVRGCADPMAARGQIVLSQVPLLIACLASGDPYLMAFGVPIVLLAVAGLVLTHGLHAQTLRILVEKTERSGLVAALEGARQELESVNAHLEALTLNDALTGIANRRAFDFTIGREWRRSLRENTRLSLLLLDVDRFRSYNEFYGRQAADLCLQEIAATIGSVLRRPGDFLARTGGKAFAVILPQTELKGAIEIGETIVKAFTTRAMPHDSAQSYSHVSVSIGAATVAAGPDTTVADLLVLADRALRAAKRGGRNRVCTPEVVDRPFGV